MCWKSPVYILICTAIAASAVVCSGFQLMIRHRLTGVSMWEPSKGFYRSFCRDICPGCAGHWPPVAGQVPWRGLWGSESGGMIQKKAVSTHWVCLGKRWVHTQRIIQDTAPAALQQQICWESLGTSSLWLRLLQDENCSTGDNHWQEIPSFIMVISLPRSCPVEMMSPLGCQIFYNI